MTLFLSAFPVGWPEGREVKVKVKVKVEVKVEVVLRLRPVKTCLVFVSLPGFAANSNLLSPACARPLTRAPALPGLYWIDQLSAMKNDSPDKIWD
jgi:hypothetical protein